MAKAKRKSTPRKTVWTDEEKLFGEKSKIVHLDLPRLFSSPEAWSTLEEAEKDQLRALLPPHVELDEDGSIPQAFLKYDPDWRNALHQFQVDLEAGRYDSTWLDEAALAMEERAAGVYDSFKETEFEEFWGQKQKVKVQLSGETASLKLADLIHANLFQVGDVWSYTRNVGKLPCERVQVEKECMVIAIIGDSLTFVIPPGRSKFVTADHYLKDKQAVGAVVNAETSQPCPNASSDGLAEAKVSEPAPSGSARPSSMEKCDEEGSASISTNRPQETRLSQILRVPSKRPWTSCDSTTLPSLPAKDTVVPVTMETDVHEVPNMNDDTSMREVYNRETSLALSQTKSSPLSTAPSSPSAPIETQPPTKHSEQSSPGGPSDGKLLRETTVASTLTITNPRALETRVLEMDGRVKSAPAANSWRMFRVRRREQDIGSLWEIREEFWAKRRPE